MPHNSPNDAYQHDRSWLKGTPPKNIFKPISHDDCVSLVKKANNTNQSLVIRGAGTGTTGGAVTSNTDDVVSLEKMNRIIELDIKNATITVEPGVILQTIVDEVEKHGLWYPLDPASASICSIGGTIAQNAGGPRAIKYGTTRDYVIGLKGVWANGDPFHLGGKQIKNVAGYDLIRLLVGSEGTLAVITEITLKLIPKPPHYQEALVCFDNPNQAVQALVAVRQSGIQPSTAEYMTQRCIDASLNYLNIQSQFTVSPAAIIFQVDGHTQASVCHQMNTIHHICRQFSTINSIPMLDEMANHIWAIRRHVSLGLKKIAKQKRSEDIVVPPASVPDFLKELEAMNHPSGIRVIGYGHLGDGNIHVNILKMSASDLDWDNYCEDIVDQVMATAVSFGGTISGEHGIGQTKKKYLPLVFSPTDLQLMQQIKKIIDPNNILNSMVMF